MRGIREVMGIMWAMENTVDIDLRVMLVEIQCILGLNGEEI